MMFFFVNNETKKNIVLLNKRWLPLVKLPLVLGILVVIQSKIMNNAVLV
jgi:hypothetical protein